MTRARLRRGCVNERRTGRPESARPGEHERPASRYSFHHDAIEAGTQIPAAVIGRIGGIGWGHAIKTAYASAASSAQWQESQEG